MKKINFLLLSSGISLFLVKNTSAYIDPGTGSTLLGSLGPFFIAIFSAIGLFLVKYFWNPIKKFFSKLKKTSKKNR